jgi:hypothetical protein
MRRLLCTCVAALVASGTLGALAVAQQQTPSSAPESRSDARGLPSRVRRDPFVRPAVAADAMPAEPAAASVQTPDGLAGLSENQITVRGVLIVDGQRVALAQGPDRRHYVIRPGDRLRDGVVQAVLPGGLVVVSNLPDSDRDGAPRTPRKPGILPHGEGQ